MNEKLVSYNSIALDLWGYLTEIYNLDIYPPPLVVDSSSDSRMPIEGQYTAGMMSGISGAACGTDSEGSNVYYGTPVTYACRIYENGIINILDNWFGCQVTGELVEVMIAKVILHEYGHFLHDRRIYVQCRHNRDLIRTGLSSQGMDDEEYNDRWADAMLWEMIVNQWTPNHLISPVIKELIPRYNGEYAIQKAEEDPEFDKRLNGYWFCLLSHRYNFREYCRGDWDRLDIGRGTVIDHRELAKRQKLLWKADGKPRCILVSEDCIPGVGMVKHETPVAVSSLK